AHLEASGTSAAGVEVDGPLLRRAEHAKPERSGAVLSDDLADQDGGLLQMHRQLLQDPERAYKSRAASRRHARIDKRSPFESRILPRTGRTLGRSLPSSERGSVG